MSIRKKYLSIVVGGIVGVCLNQTVIAADEAGLEKVVVTGSHIKRVDVEGSLPLVTLDGEKIQLSGVNTLSELLRDLTFNNGASFDEKYILSFAPGSSGVSLRGLGQDGTLILLNGRRVASHGFALEGTDTFVDLNSLPLAAVDRIEILKDGASAIYGSDAMAGVINIITKKNYSGTEVAANYGMTSHLDANEGSVNVLSGFNSSKMNLTLGADYFYRKGFYLGDREFSKSADHSDQAKGVDYSSLASPTASVLDLGSGDFLAVNPYNTNPVTTAIPGTQRMGVMGDFSFDLTPSVTFFTEAMLRNIATTVQLPPTPYATPVFDTNPNNGYGSTVLAIWRVAEAGNRTYDIDTTVQRVVSGLEGSLAAWDWETSALYNVSKTVMKGSNFIDANKLDASIADGTLNPFGNVPNSASDIDAVKINTERTGTYKLYEASAKASSAVMELASGSVYLALGANARYESLADIPDDALKQGIVVGTGGTEANGSRKVYDGFTEINIPVIDDLELQVAGRYEQYSDFGGTANPKLALRYQPLENVLFRGSVGTGFRAPSLAEMNTGTTTNYEILIDTDRCAATNDAADCSAQQIQVDLKGNPNLDPEKSLSYNLGVVVDLMKRLEVSIDYWNYSISDVITSDTQYMLNNEADFSADIHRDAASGGVPGAIQSIDGTYYNFSQTKTDGVDVDAAYRFALGSLADAYINESMTFTNSYDLKRTKDDSFEKLAGTFRYPKVRSTTQIGAKRGDIGVNMTVNYIHSYQDNNYENDKHVVGKYLTFDAQASYKCMKTSQVIAGMKNVFDTDPPFSNLFVEGFDIATHSPRGRFAYLTLKHTF